jgi:cyclopropane fatty-acyl-phospholipid synthase-like methyltransferase
LKKSKTTIKTPKELNMYDGKKPNYFSNSREDIFSLLPGKVERVLEVGCGSGETLSKIKSRFPYSTTVGIELSENAAKLAISKVDLLKNLDIEKEESRSALGQFDLILLLDVLEHLRDPWTTLQSLVRDNLTTGGTVITSIPNARNHGLIIQLLRGDFNYTEAGVLDKTHLRFFTKKSMHRLIQDSGLSILTCQATNVQGDSRSAFINKLTFGLFEDFLAVQYIVKSIKTEYEFREP